MNDQNGMAFVRQISKKKCTYRSGFHVISTLIRNTIKWHKKPTEQIDDGLVWTKSTIYNNRFLLKFVIRASWLRSCFVEVAAAIQIMTACGPAASRKVFLTLSMLNF